MAPVRPDHIKTIFPLRILERKNVRIWRCSEHRPNTDRLSTRNFWVNFEWISNSGRQLEKCHEIPGDPSTLRVYLNINGRNENLETPEKSSHIFDRCVKPKIGFEQFWNKWFISESLYPLPKNSIWFTRKFRTWPFAWRTKVWSLGPVRWTSNHEVLSKERLLSPRLWLLN